MKFKIFALALASLIITFTFSKPADGYQGETAASSAVLKNEAKTVDSRAQKLEAYLIIQGSPMAKFGQDFVDAADRYGLDWKLLAAIAGVESTYGKKIPANSFNAYGWNNGVWQFISWPDSINYVSKALKEKYFDRGLDSVAKIGPVYAPPSQTWTGKITLIMEKIETFTPEARLETLTLTI